MWKTLRNLIFGGLSSKVLLGLANILVIKYLSKSDYAQLSNFQFIQSLISGLFFSPFLLSSVVGSNLFQLANARRLFAALNLIQICLVFVLFAAALLYGESLSVDLFHKPQFYYSLILGLLSSIFLTFQNIILSQHQTREAYGIYNLINNLRPVLLIAMLWMLQVAGMLNFWSASLAFLASIVLSVGGEIRFLGDALRWSGMRFRFRQFAWFWKKLRFLILFFFVRAILDHIATFMVSRYFDLDANASYGVAFRYYAMIDLVIYSAHIAFMNSFTRDEPAFAHSKFIRWMKVALPLGLAGIAVLNFSEPIFLWINGAQYADAFPVFSAFMMGLTVYLAFSPVIYGVARTHNFGWLLGISLVALGIQLLGTWYSARIQYLPGMAWSSVTARGFIYVSSLLFYLRNR